MAQKFNEGHFVLDPLFPNPSKASFCVSKKNVNENMAAMLTENLRIRLFSLSIVF